MIANVKSISSEITWINKNLKGQNFFFGLFNIVIITNKHESIAINITNNRNANIIIFSVESNFSSHAFS